MFKNLLLIIASVLLLSACNHNAKIHRDYTNGVWLTDHKVYFDSKSATLSKEAMRTLDHCIRKFKTTHAKLIGVIGHADYIGSKQANLTLSQQRSDAVMNYLKKNGVNNQMISVGQGEYFKMFLGKDNRALQENRIVEIRIMH